MIGCCDRWFAYAAGNQLSVFIFGSACIIEETCLSTIVTMTGRGSQLLVVYDSESLDYEVIDVMKGSKSIEVCPSGHPLRWNHFDKNLPHTPWIRNTPCIF